MKTKMTMQQIADLCNVSRGTVDRVVHNRPNVHPQIRRRVLAVLEKTGYLPPSLKRKARDVRRIGILIRENAEPYIAAQLRHGIATAQSRLGTSRLDFMVRTVSGRSEKEYLQSIDAFLESGIDGLILNLPMTSIMTDQLNMVLQQKIPAITYFDEIPRCPEACYIGPDAIRAGRAGAGLMAKYLRPGEQVLAVTGNPDFHSHRARAYSFATHLRSLTGQQGIARVIYCNELFEETAGLVHTSLKADESIRYIYMATQSVPGCIEGIRRAALPYKICVIASDLTPASREYLLTGEVDFVIAQRISYNMFLAIEALYKLLCFEIPFKSQKLYTDLTIITQQMVSKRRLRNEEKND